MKWLLYLLVLGAVFLVPTERSDVGKLQPIEVVCVSAEGDSVIIETDTGDLGKGQSVDEALADLKRTTAGIVYLDTAEYLLVRDGAQDLIADLGKYLHKKVRLCMVEGDGELADAAAFLDVHNPEQTMRDYSGELGEKLVEKDGRFHLEKKNEKR